MSDTADDDAPTGTSISEILNSRLEARVGRMARQQELTDIVLEEVARRALGAGADLTGLGLSEDWIEDRRAEAIEVGYGGNRQQRRKKAAAKKPAARR